MSNIPISSIPFSPRPFDAQKSTTTQLAAQLDLMRAERDELKRDNENMLKTLLKVSAYLERSPALLMEVRSALKGV